MVRLSYTLPGRSRYLVVFGIALFFLFQLLVGVRIESSKRHVKIAADFVKSHLGFSAAARHPIDDLIRSAERRFEDLVASQVSNLDDVEAAYIKRRGRRPPPGFDDWYKYAQQRNATFIEAFFDPIYRDLGPFWGVSPEIMRLSARRAGSRLAVRKHNVSIKTEVQISEHIHWRDTVARFSAFLPDIDIPLNDMDESRILAKWETVDQAMNLSVASRHVVPENAAVTKFGRTSDADSTAATPYDAIWHVPEGNSYQYEKWERASLSCPPNAAFRDLEHYKVDLNDPVLPFLHTPSAKSYHGYVQNYTAQQDVCDNPRIAQMHASFTGNSKPHDTTRLVPIFSASKIQMANDIVLPAAPHLSPDQPKPDDSAWDTKLPSVFWRGGGTGGDMSDKDWMRFSRYRLVSMMNATTVERSQKGDAEAPMFVLPEKNAYDLGQLGDEFLGDWLGKHANVSLQYHGFDTYEFLDPWYSLSSRTPREEPYKYKFLPDVDGYAYSGRFLTFLRSTSLPIKSALYQEWSDARLVAWKHFVPMDHTFSDIYGILAYFMGNGTNGHDREAEKIALDGKEWAEQVLRLEDMEIYLFRLLLEYARLCDDDRNSLAWIAPHNVSV
ncbi:hypothetical protein ANO11243_093240 [Dothideomycetidae sp. 11243]|nr:hypothetical protein ANO11243_093240 [fungal sp. No.11243]